MRFKDFSQLITLRPTIDQQAYFQYLYGLLVIHIQTFYSISPRYNAT